MKYQHISGREADKRRRLLRDIQSAKRYKNLQELHEFKEKMRAGAESANKINELRRIEGYLAHLQPGARIHEIRNQPHLQKARQQLLDSIGLKETPM